jgi:signal transduction histidine kinase
MTTQDAVLALAVGAALVASGGALATGPRRRRMALLMVATGVTWWLGGLGDWSLFWHRGPMTHALLAYPTGRLRGRTAVAVVAGGYVLAVAAALDRHGTVGVAYAVVVTAATVWSSMHAHGSQRAPRWRAAAVTVLIMGALAVGALWRGHDAGAQPVALRLYEAAVGVGFLLLTAGDLWDRWSQPTTTRMVVELGAAPAAGRISGLVADVLGDPAAELFYWLPDAGGFVDEAGQPAPKYLGLPSRRAITLEHDGERVGMLLHDPGVDHDPGLLATVSALASLAIAGVRLRADVEAKKDVLEASRRRVVTAADREREQLAAQVRDDVMPHLASVSARLARVAQRNPDLDAAVSSAQQSLDDFAAGVDPVAQAADGVGGALAELVDAFPVPVRLEVSGGRSSASAESSAYYVCAEALSNVGKHADATHVVVRVEVSAELVRVVVADDGVGGASLKAGTGLAGLRDRVDALGGTLTVDSPPGGGTRVAAVIPA